MAVKKGLGKGLDSLITDKVNKPGAAKDAHLHRQKIRQLWFLLIR